MTLAIVGYADRMSVRPGDTLKVMVSCEAGAGSYRARLVRLICGDDSPKEPAYKEQPIEHPANGAYPGRRQRINAGSYVLVPASPPLESVTSFTLQALIWPTTPGRGPQTLLARRAESAGYALMIDEGGALALSLGDGEKSEMFSTGAPLDARAWYLVSASYDAQTQAVRVSQQPLRERAQTDRRRRWRRWRASCRRLPTQTPFMMAAHVAGEQAGRLVTGGHYNGKIEAPRLGAAGAGAGRGGDLVAAGTLRAEIPGDEIVDVSGNGLDGVAGQPAGAGDDGAAWTGECMTGRSAPIISGHPLSR